MASGFGKGQIRVDVGVVIVRAIQLVTHPVCAGAIDFGILLTWENAALAVRRAVVGGDILRSRDEKNQLLHITAIQGQANNLLLVDKLTKCRRVGRNHCRVFGNDDFLCNRADL